MSSQSTSHSIPHPANTAGRTDYTDYSNSCIPSAIPPNIDPSLVDFREFYPYIPNEVKHRKRTTQAQLEILEDTFKRDKKPNSALRTALARDLDMTPRGVQVWFQNRRAKEKTLAKKAVQRRNNDNVNPNLNQASTSPESDHARTPDDKKLNRSPHHIATSMSPSSEGPDSASTTSPIPAIRYEIPPNPRFALGGDANLRRGSLPIIMRSTSDDPASYSRRLAPSHDLLARRSSFDTNIGRLATHPYAALAFANNSAIYGKVVGNAHHHLSTKIGSLPGGPEQLLMRSPRIGSRLGPVHRASMPYIYAQSHRSVSSGGLSNDGPFDHTQTFTSRRHDGMYAMPSRVVHAPIDGPLPTPNFSFGDSSSSPSAPSPPASECSDHMSRGLNYAFPNDPDTEDDHTHSSFDAFSSRFGSITSLAGSESSMTSAYYSETGSCVSDRHEYPSGFEPDSRRPSHSSAHMLDHFSALELGSQTSPAIPTEGPFGQDLMLSTSSPNESESNGDNSPATTTYHSPASTVSNGSDSQNQSAEGNVRISLSSELALALSSSTRDIAVKQELSDPNLNDSRVNSARLETSRSNSSPMLDPGNVLGNGSRACYDLDYADHTYGGVFGDQSFGPQQGHYGTSSYSAQGHSPHNLSTSNSPPLSVYPAVQEVFR